MASDSWQTRMFKTLDAINEKLDAVVKKQADDDRAQSKKQSDDDKKLSERVTAVESRVNMALAIAGAVGLMVLGIIAKMAFK
jgi:DNA-directed RNA polymerase delta subunit